MSTSLQGFPPTDRYEPLAELGRGGSGVVFLAFDRLQGLRVALKTLHRFSNDDVELLKREFRSLAGLCDPHVIQLFELASSTNGQCYLTMEYVEKVDFLRYVRPEHTRGSFDEARVRHIFAQIARGVAVLHKAGFLHRDIKPSNVLISSDGRARLIDFNLLHSVRADPLSPQLSQRAAGTPDYMSPEQLENQRLTTATDWYSFGVMLYEALTGYRPFKRSMTGRDSSNALFPSTGSEFERTVTLGNLARQSLEQVIDMGGLDPQSDLTNLCQALLHTQPEQRPGAKEVLACLERAAIAPISKAVAQDRRDLFIGREAELAKLEEALAAVRGGSTVAVAVRGPSGVGKTALLRRFLEQVGPGALVLAGRCFERDSVPYNAFDELVEGLCHRLRRLGTAEIRALKPRNCHSLARLFTAFHGVNGFFSATAVQPEALDPIEQRRRGFAALKELLGRIADQRTLILCLDDVQWADQDSALLLEELFRPPDAPAMLLIVSSRNEGTAASSLDRLLETLRSERNHDQVRSMPLAPLAAADAESLAHAVLGAADADAHQLASAVVRESEGHPYLLKELCRYAASASESGRSDLGATAPTLDEMLRARLQGLPAPACRILEVVAIAGGPVAQTVALEAAGAAADDRYRTLLLLQDEHLVRTSGPSGEDSVELYHDRIREGIVRCLDPGQLREAHACLATALEKWGHADSQTLALHYAAAGARASAAKFAALAAREAAQSLAFESAARLYRLALSLREPGAPGNSELQIALGDELANAGRGPESAAAYLEAAQGANFRQSLELRRRAAEQLLVSGHIDEGIALISKVLEAVGLHLAKTPRAAMLSLIWQRSLVALTPFTLRQQVRDEFDDLELLRADICWSIGRGLATVDLVRANDFQARHLLLALRLGDPTRLARALAMEVGIVAIAGRRAQRRTQRLIARAKALALEVNDPHALGIVTYMEGMAQFLVGRWSAAVGLLTRADAIFRERCKNVSWEITSSQNFAHTAQWFLGNIAELADNLPALLRSARERGNVFAVSSGGRNAHYVGLAEDDPERARLSVEEALAGFSQAGFHLQHYNMFVAHVQIALYVGAFDAGWRHVQDSWRPLVRSLLMRTQVLRIDAWYVRARCALALAGSRRDDATRFLAVAERDAASIANEQVDWGRPHAALIRATIAHLKGKPARAKAGLEEAAAGFAGVEMRLCEASVRRRLGCLTGDASLVAEADAWMSRQRIKNPARMAAMLAPGLDPR